MTAPRSFVIRASRSLAGAVPKIASASRFAHTRQCIRPIVPSYSATSSTRSRLYSSEATASTVEPPDYLDENELKIFNMLKDGLKPTKLEVQDISGGCGSMYALDVVSSEFTGLPIVKQHRLVNKILGEEIKKWHGVQMKTKSP